MPRFNGGICYLFQLIPATPLFTEDNGKSLSVLSQSMCLQLLFTFSFLSISLFFYFSLCRRLKRPEEPQSHDPDRTSLSALKLSLSKITDKTLLTHEPNSIRLSQTLLLQLLPSNSPRWGGLFSSVRGFDDSAVSGSDSADSGVDCAAKNERLGEMRRKKKRAKKKKQSSSDLADLQSEDGGERRRVEEEPGVKNKDELICFYPFTSSSTKTQRKIKQQYDELVKSHESSGLTLSQVGQFVNCLVDARNELQSKSDIIQRKFTITKALLLKADRSSFDRLRQQIYRLELEQKRLEEDAFVYNWLQHQLKLSPAYKKMLEIGDSMELKAESGKPMKNPETEPMDISFEEFLAQEKKDSFWQKHGKSRLCSS
ncbi:hypothetical protein Nepgr_005593 [Nepenthes gracilis]|uniref:AT1G17665-like protein n=1 Tax=Nepenthes gracilis TaxID=150966 RepID=A0AAD3S3H7_NEPGR|nr:hypothetical protein Nepgr_005593 [Nepenthes gracilis]